ncbi:MAG: hypothetical protein L6R28_04005 [Planctomycetes bacterium]|nr:hypothetical protein [Planctomycetota bacterium]
MANWTPRQGGAGEALIHWGVQNLINGGTSVYSNPPTQAQVDAGSGINQIVAELKRQGGGGSVGYTNTTTRMGVTYLNSIKTAIDALRTAQGWPAYSWTVWPISATALLSDQHLYEMRKAVTGPLIVSASASFFIQSRSFSTITQEPPYPPTGTRQVGTPVNPLLVNGFYWEFIFFGQDRQRTSSDARAYLNFAIPAGVSNATARLRLYMRRDFTNSNCDFTDYDMQVYRLDSPIPVPSTQAQIDAAWNAAKTLIVAQNIGILCPARAIRYENEFIIPSLSTGDLTLLFANSGEIAGQKPVRNDALPFVEYKHTEIYRTFNSINARLIFA